MRLVIIAKNQILNLIYSMNTALLLGRDINLESAKQRLADHCVKVVEVVSSNVGNSFLSINVICNQFNVIIDEGAHKFNLMLNWFINDFPMLKLGRAM